MAKSEENRGSFYKLALIGHPVAHSLSPLLHRAALTFCGLPGSYEVLDIAPPLSAASVHSLIGDGFSGFNVTIPHKQAIVSFATKLTEEATCVGAVNTIRITSEGRLIGHNTDVGGFVRVLKAELFRLCGAVDSGRTESLSAVIIGAGGASRAAMMGLSTLGVGVAYVIARNVEKAKLACAAVSASQAQLEHNTQLVPAAISEIAALPACDILINATPIGLTDSFVPDWVMAAFNLLLRQGRNGCWSGPGLVFDMVYASAGRMPAIVSLAHSMNMPVIDGLPMLVHQAAAAFEFWTGASIPVEVMFAAVGE